MEFSSLLPAMHLRTQMKLAPKLKWRQFKDIPGPTSLPFMSKPTNVLPQIGVHYNIVGVSMMDKYRRKYGDIVRFGTNLRDRPAVFLFDPTLFEEVYENNHQIEPKFNTSPLAYYQQIVLGKRSLIYSKKSSALQHSGQYTKTDSSKILEAVLMSIEKMANEELEPLYNIESIIYRWAIESILMQTLQIQSNNEVILNQIKSILEEIYKNCYNFKSKIMLNVESDVFAEGVYTFEHLHKLIDQLKSDENLEHKESSDQSFQALDRLVSTAEIMVHTSIAMLYFIALNPAKQQLLHDNMRWNINNEYLDACLKETNRLYIPTGGLVRRTTSEIFIHEYQIPEGIDLVMAYHITSRDRNQYSRPNDFIPERWLSDKSNALYFGHAHPHSALVDGRESINNIKNNVRSLVGRLVSNYIIEWHGPKAEFCTRSLNCFNISNRFVFKKQ